MMDGLDAKFWLSVANYLVVGVVGVVGWWWRKLSRAQQDINDNIAAQNKAHKSSVEAMRKDYDALEHRVLRVESEIQHMPTRVDIGDIYEVTNKIHGDLQKITGSHEALTRQMEMMNQYLMENGK